MKHIRQLTLAGSCFHCAPKGSRLEGATRYPIPLLRNPPKADATRSGNLEVLFIYRHLKGNSGVCFSPALAIRAIV